MFRFSWRSRIAVLGSGLALVGVAVAQTGQDSGETASEQARSAAVPARFRVGIMFQPGPPPGEGAGLEISGVAPGSAGERAGLLRGDVITHVNGGPAGTDPREFAHLFGSADPIELQVRRGDKSLKFTVVPEAVDSVAAARAAPYRKSVSSAQGATVIPMRMGYGKPSILVTVNGAGPWEFFLDSGAGATVVDRSLVDELKMPIQGKQRIGGPSDPEAIEGDLVKVSSLDLGGLAFDNVEAVSWDRSQLYPGPDGQGPRGVLGLGMFEGYMVTFDYPSAEIVIERGALPAVDRNEIIPYTMGEWGIPIFEIQVADRTMKAHIDTGSPADLSVPARREEDFRFLSPPRVVGKGRTVNEEFEIRAARLDGNVKIGGHVFEKPQITLVSILDVPDAANIGSGLLREFTLTFDLKNQRVRLRRP